MNVDVILAAMRDADYGRPGLHGARLLTLSEPFAASLRREVRELLGVAQGSDVAQSDHVTHWAGPDGDVRQYSLLNGSGRYADTATDHLLTTRAKAFAERRHYRCLARLLAAFPEAINCRVNVLGPGATLSPHEEHITVRTRSGTVALKARFHLPLLTNPDAEVMLAGEVFHLDTGVIHYVNNGCMHAASNGGARARVHLVWDTLLTKALGERLFGNAAHGLPATRIDAAERSLVPRRRIEIESHRRSRPTVAWEAAQGVGYFEMQ